MIRPTKIRNTLTITTRFTIRINLTILQIHKKYRKIIFTDTFNNLSLKF